MVFPQDNGFAIAGPSKENGDGSPPTLWQNLFQLGLKILSAIMGGGVQSESIEKIDSGSPLQVSWKFFENGNKIFSKTCYKITFFLNELDSTT